MISKEFKSKVNFIKDVLYNLQDDAHCDVTGGYYLEQAINELILVEGKFEIYFNIFNLSELDEDYMDYKSVPYSALISDIIEELVELSEIELGNTRQCNSIITGIENAVIWLKQEMRRISL